MKKRNFKGLALAPAANEPVNKTPENDQMQAFVGGLSQRADSRDEVPIRPEDLIVLKEIGHGNGGTVSKVQHRITKQIMARKVSACCFGLCARCAERSDLVVFPPLPYPVPIQSHFPQPLWCLPDASGDGREGEVGARGKEIELDPPR